VFFGMRLSLFGLSCQHWSSHRQLNPPTLKPFKLLSPTLSCDEVVSMHFQVFSLFYSGTLLGMALVIAHPLHPQTAVLQTRNLVGGILGDGFGPVVPPVSDINTVNTNSQTAATGAGFPVQTSSILTGGASKVPTTVSTASSQTTTPSITQTTTGRPSETSSAAVSSTTSIQIGYVADAPATPPGEATEWKVIGIAVISIAFITTVVLSITFFDSWWGFLRAIFLGDKRNGGDEKLVPDWDRQSWEYNLSKEDGHRYPTMASLESIVKTPEKSASAGDVKSSEFVTTTRLSSQHDFFHCGSGLINSNLRSQQLVRDASLKRAGIKS
jgi:hypothetical protein